MLGVDRACRPVQYSCRRPVGNDPVRPTILWIETAPRCPLHLENKQGPRRSEWVLLAGFAGALAMEQKLRFSGFRGARTA